MASLYSAVSTDFTLLLCTYQLFPPCTISPWGYTWGRHGDLAKSVLNERCDHAKVEDLTPNIDLLSGNECYMALPI